MDEAFERVREAALRNERLVSERLNAAVRRIRQAADPVEWEQTVQQVASEFAATARLIRAAEASGAAIRQAIETGEVAVAARTAGEVSPALAGPGRMYLFPIAKAFVLAAEEPLDAAALELIAGVAAMSPPKAKGLLGIAPAGPGSAKPSWDSLPKTEQERHLKAQRFARVRAAELLHYHPDAVRAGRAGRRLYDALKIQIDAARTDFAAQFRNGTALPDYLHLELVRTLAQDDETLLGVEYPGPLL